MIMSFTHHPGRRTVDKTVLIIVRNKKDGCSLVAPRLFRFHPPSPALLRTGLPFPCFVRPHPALAHDGRRCAIRTHVSRGVTGLERGLFSDPKWWLPAARLQIPKRLLLDKKKTKLFSSFLKTVENFEL